MSVQSPKSPWDTSSRDAKPRRVWFGQQLSDEDSAELARQIALLAERGLPLPAGLRALGAEQPSARLRRALGELADQLESGKSLPEALDQLGSLVPPSVRALLLAGIKSGRFVEVVEEHLHNRARLGELQRRMRNLLIYPGLLVIVCMVALVLMEHFVISQFREMYDEFDASLPPLTHGVLMVSSGVAYFIVGAAAAFVAMWLLLLLGSRSAFRRRLAYRLPLVGRLWRFTVLAQFTRLAALLVRHSVPLPDALHLSAGATGDPELRRSVGRVVTAILAGKPLGARLAADRSLPAGLAQVITWGEDQNALGESLLLAGEMYEARAIGQLSFTAMIAPPLGLTIALFFFGLIIIALMLPLIELLETLA